MIETPSADVTPPKPARRSAQVVLFLTVFIDLLGFGVMMPLLPVYGSQYGASPTEIGLLVGIYSLMQFIFAPIWGSLSDRIGRRPVLLLSLLGNMAAYVIFGLATSLWVLFVSRAVAGIMAANIAAAQAYIADTTSLEDRARGMGMIGAAFGLGFVFGPAIGGVASHWGPSIPPFIAAGLSAGAFLLALIRLPESRSASSRPRKMSLEPLLKAFSEPNLVFWMVAFMLLTIAFAALETTLPLLLTAAPFHYTREQNGFVFTYIGVMVALIQGGGIRHMVKRSGEARLAQRGAICLGVGMALVPFSHSLPMLLLSLLFVSMGQGMCHPTLMSLISKGSSREEQGSVLGVAQSLSSLGRIVGPPLGGGLFGMSIGLPYGVGSALMLLAFFLAARGQKQSLRTAD